MFHPQTTCGTRFPPGWYLLTCGTRGWRHPTSRQVMLPQVEYDRELRTSLEHEGAALSEVVGPVCEGIQLPRWPLHRQGASVNGPRWGPRVTCRIAWPAVVIASAETCEPLFRVRSAYILAGYCHGQWLSNSEGFVVGVAWWQLPRRSRPGDLRSAIARLHPEPELKCADLPPPPPDLAFSPGPVPAPTGNGRYFAYGFPVVYDALGDRWIPVNQQVKFSRTSTRSATMSISYAP